MASCACLWSDYSDLLMIKAIKPLGYKWITKIACLMAIWPLFDSRLSNAFGAEAVLRSSGTVVIFWLMSPFWFRAIGRNVGEPLRIVGREPCFWKMLHFKPQHTSMYPRDCESILVSRCWEFLIKNHSTKVCFYLVYGKRMGDVRFEFFSF